MIFLECISETASDFWETHKKSGIPSVLKTNHSHLGGLVAVAGDKVGPLAALPRSRGNPEALDPGRSCPGSQPITHASGKLTQ